MKTFDQIFAGRPAAMGEAPGRVNLLGEHTDYNEGYVLPTAVPMKTIVSVGLAGGSDFSLYAANLDAAAGFSHTQRPDEPFARYVYGCVRELMTQGVDVPPLDIHVASSIPMGVGLSSSAALEVATLRALTALMNVSIDPVVIARMAQQAEIEYAGVQCGILDQMACSLADTESMLFVDTQTLHHHLLPLPDDSEILVVHSGVTRSLATSGYNRRRQECETAARLLRVVSLREVNNETEIDHLPEELRRRVRHVISENSRVQQAIAAIDAVTFGACMNASQHSLMQDYEVSIPELDRLAALLQAQPEVFGAKLTGAGFGGACVALCRKGSARQAGENVVARYNHGNSDATIAGRILVPALR